MSTTKGSAVLKAVILDDRGQPILDGAVSGPGGEVRFGVGSQTEAQSSTWRLWANRTGGSDVYVASRPLAGVQKVSLHQSGDWRFQFVKSWADKNLAAGECREIDAWPRPPETITGWTRSLVIWIPASDVTKLPTENDRKDILWVPKPSETSVVVFQIVIARPDTGFVRLQETIPLNAFVLVNGECCLLLMSIREMTVEQHQWLQEYRAKIAKEISHLDLSQATAPRITLFGRHADGVRMMWDLDARRSIAFR